MRAGLALVPLGVARGTRIFAELLTIKRRWYEASVGRVQNNCIICCVRHYCCTIWGVWHSCAICRTSCCIGSRGNKDRNIGTWDAHSPKVALCECGIKTVVEGTVTPSPIVIACIGVGGIIIVIIGHIKLPYNSLLCHIGIGYQTATLIIGSRHSHKHKSIENRKLLYIIINWHNNRQLGQLEIIDRCAIDNKIGTLLIIIGYVIYNKKGISVDNYIIVIGFDFSFCHIYDINICCIC